MDYPTLKPEGEQREATVNRHSSIDQYNDFPLVAVIGGVAHPITFDVIDYVGPECLKTHRSILVNGDDIGFNFPVGKCKVIEDEYLVFDKDGMVLKALPEWTGMEGFYYEYQTGISYVNMDGSSLGQRNVHTRDIGLDYVLAEKTLQATE